MAKKGFMDGYKTYDDSEGRGSARQWKREFYERISSDEAAQILSEQEQTPWEILDIPKGSTQAVIKKAFRKLIIEWHPDKNPHRLQQAEAMSKIIIAAYSSLIS